MVDSFFLAVKVSFPLVVFIGAGMLIRRYKLVSAITVKEMNDVVFKVLLATMVFFNIYQSDLKDDFDVKVLLFAVLSLVVIIFVLWYVVGRFVKDKTIAPVIIQGMYRSNFVLFGLQVTASICGYDNLGMVTILIAVIIPMFNIIAVIIFESYRNTIPSIKRLLSGIMKNPLIIASILGLLALLFKVGLGDTINDTLSTLSKTATPMSLLLLGASITLSGIKKYWKTTLCVSAVRLVIIPGIFLTLAIMIGIRDNSLVGLMVMFASPTAVSSFPMAVSMGGNGELAGQIVATTTVLSVFTIFLWTYLLNFCGFIG